MREQDQRQQKRTCEQEQQGACAHQQQRRDILPGAGQEKNERVAEYRAQRKLQLCGKGNGVHAEGKNDVEPQKQGGEQREPAPAGSGGHAGVPAQEEERKADRRDAARQHGAEEPGSDVTEKVPEDVDVLCALHAEHRAAKRRQRGRDGHDRDAAEKEGEIQQDEIDPVIPDDLREGFHVVFSVVSFFFSIA